VTDPAARIQALADRCVLCGLCLPHCPTYRHDRVEGESPRGRIALAKGIAQGRLDPADSDAWRGIDHCLGCRRCEAVCPANVEYGELLVQARHLKRSHVAPAARQRLLEWLVRRPRWLSVLLGGVRTLRPLLPRTLRRRLPVVPAAHRLNSMYPAQGERRGSVALFLGCVARRLDAPVHLAAIKVLTRLGWDVHVPAPQHCCGALHRHAGDLAGAARLRGANAAAFADPVLQAVIVSASGCFDDVRDALADGAPVRELLEFVAGDSHLDRLALQPRPQRVALHTPCTQGSVVHAPDAAAKLLQRIPSLELLPISGLGCCGAAGNHMLLQPARADAIRSPLLQAALDTSASRLCSGNIGCRLHLQAGLDERGAAVQTHHPIELLAEALS